MNHWCRSYTLPQCILALQALGVYHKLISIYSPLKKGYVINVANGASQEVSYGINGRALLETLAEELAPDTIRFSSKFTSIRTVAIDDEFSSSVAIISLEDGIIIRPKILIGCDGVHSTVGRWLGLMAPVYSGRSCIRGLAEIYRFVDQGKRAAYIPFTDKELYWFLTYNSTLKDEKAAADTKLLQKDVMKNLANDFPPSFLEVVQHADLATVTWAPLIRYPWDQIFGHVCKGNITVAGDAIHPMTPELGQGGCSALEDAVVLGRHLAKFLLPNPNGHGQILAVDEARAIEGYVKERRWRVVGLITGFYLSSWVQQSGSGFFMKFLRDIIFYRFLFHWVLMDTIFYRFLFHRVFVVHYDCGKLPSVSSLSETDDQTKID
ncbi:hypothetical protein NE237_030437 [Protea cynaroides]|uniref:FAD-binding domain-containing protein n=1 Tax=Protea cynaroides TaxID=273540 RepID=A0A9Q0GW64_9MAGN|nr:hypothetical protein NE237_030437 [Protea cynaroides]